jgi:hypothetical protein
MLEYYRRIAYANRHFTRHREGWQMDMGEVYVKLGPPDSATKVMHSDRYVDTLSMAEPAIVWQYFDLGRVALFEYIGGEYRLKNLVELFDLLNDGMRF